MVLLVAYMVQQWLGLDWGAISRWQQNFSYRVATGSLLAGFVGAQWFLALARWRGWTHVAKSSYAWHQRLGSIAPCLLFVHSTRLGFGYLLVLAGVYLGNTLVGLFSPNVFSRLRGYQTPWMAAHVALSIALVPLLLYHAWTALYFE